ncbi:MAG: hypothetical protein HRU80_15190 [Ignavibacteriales bacterium]|nr:MAG: hypothetical protein HRU80_15190 [Ignavibacteriales bacterium]
MVNRFLVLFAIIIGGIFPQDFSRVKEAAGAYISSGGMEIIASDDRLTVNHPVSGKITQQLTGVKKIIPSPSGTFFLLLNFGFQPDKSDYPVSLFLVSRSSGLIYTKDITASFDLPHPLFAVDDNGVIYSFEPLRMILSSDLRGSITETAVVENAEFTMERTFFLKAGSASVTGASNILGRDDAGENIVLFTYTPADGNIQSVRLKGSTLSGFDEAGGQLLLSVNRESESGVYPETRLMNTDFTESITLAEPAIYMLTPDRFITRQGKITGRDGSSFASPLPGSVKAVTGVYTLDETKTLLTAVTGAGNEFFIYDTASGAIRKADGISAGKDSRMEIFIFGRTLFAVENYVKTTIYQIN